MAANTIKPLTGALNLQYKSGVNAWTNGLTLQDLTGYVGIGTTSPARIFEVSSGVGTYSKITSTTGGDAAIQFATGGTDSYIGQLPASGGTNNGLNIYTGGATRMTISNSGSVGIGTTTPLAALDVAGSASLSANMFFKGAGTAHTFNILDNGTLNFQRYPGGDSANNSSVLFLGNNGNVGIGTTAPGANLDIYSSTASVLSRVQSTIHDATLRLDGNEGSIIQFYRNNAADWDITRTAYTSDLYFNANGQGGYGNGAVVFKSGGNVGIGVSNPTGRLSVAESGAKTATDYGLYLANTTTSSTGSVDKYGAYISNTGTWNASTSNNYGLYVKTSGGYNDVGITSEISDGSFAFSTVNAGSSNKTWGLMPRGNNLAIREAGTSDVMTFKAGGNVGIGVTNPGTALDN